MSSDIFIQGIPSFDNIESVLSKYNLIVLNLRLSTMSDIEKVKYCLDVCKNADFVNTCVKAIKEIKYNSAYNPKLMETYLHKFINLESELHLKFKDSIILYDVDVALKQINDVKNNLIDLTTSRDASEIGKRTDTIESPFNDVKTLDLFNYIVDNWSYNKGQKWADIWKEINNLENYKAPYKNDYQSYIIKRFGYTGKFQYEKVKRETNKDRIELLMHIFDFKKKET